MAGGALDTNMADGDVLADEGEAGEEVRLRLVTELLD
jgi:hypothetical protein